MLNTRLGKFYIPGANLTVDKQFGSVSRKGFVQTVYTVKAEQVWYENVVGLQLG